MNTTILYAIDEPIDHSSWDAFLKKFVNEQGEVDYRGVILDPSLVEEYQKVLKNIDFGALHVQGPREEELALVLNAYHVGIVTAVRIHGIIKSLNDIPGIWKIPLVELGEERHSLDEIKMGMLLERFRDEKIHMALSCGAKSCPKFPREAFTGPRVEGQLYLAAKEFVNDPIKNRIIPGSKKIEISKIFKWYGRDFRLDFGMAQNDLNLTEDEFAVLSFLAHYLDDAEKIQFLEEDKYKLKYLPFDWDLNLWVKE
ncbi:MAG: DUF547 domain-containing protein [Candidatus Omnitrophica bacterium]|nr:DUF547 domain-containing protein [Candidatus Omnitrophota bacterium]